MEGRGEEDWEEWVSLQGGTGGAVKACWERYLRLSLREILSSCVYEW